MLPVKVQRDVGKPNGEAEIPLVEKLHQFLLTIEAIWRLGIACPEQVLEKLELDLGSVLSVCQSIYALGAQRAIPWDDANENDVGLKDLAETTAGPPMIDWLPDA